MSFYDRICSSEYFARQLFKEFEKMGFCCALNGTEHTHSGFVANLRQSTDQTSLAIRFQPDGVVCVGDAPKTYYVEAKNATNIEKLAYEQYMKLYQAGNYVVVVFGKFQRKWHFIQCIDFKPSLEVVSKYANPWPVVNEWICPRLHPDWERLKLNYPHMSGTPYREVDSRCLASWEDIKWLK